MRRFRAALLIPAMALAGGVAAGFHSAPVASTGAGHVLAFCVINPVTDSGCLPVPCPSKLPFPCPQVAVAAKL
ncbi:MAG TPA: hypothetical protein VN193_10020 [Candidatus Angelobacter sp.]|jgi:hypothetical protein|nr:hypothetical protein [Candidatus Angelobacter sp.]